MDESPRHPPNDRGITPTQNQIYAAIRAWLIVILPSIPPKNIIQGQANRVASPKGPYCTLVITGRERLATNNWTYDGSKSREINTPTQVTMSLNIFGRDGSDAMQTVTALWRDQHAVTFFRAQNIPLAPLTTSSVRQIGFVNAEKQYEDLWSIDLLLQVNFSLPTPQDFSQTLNVTTAPA